MLIQSEPRTVRHQPALDVQTAGRRWIPLILFLVPLLYLLWRAPSIEHYLESPDHGYPFGVGRQLLLGKLPFKDVFIHYGPFTAYTCSLAMRLWDTPLSESIVCCLAYALALFCLGSVLYRRASFPMAITGIFGGLLLLARFHKWWYWLFPLLCVYVLNRADSGKRPRMFGVLLGVLIVVAGLYRLDLGAACFLATLTSQVLMNVARGREKFKNLSYILAGICLSEIAWLIFLGWQSGWTAIGSYFSFSLAGIHTQVKNVHTVPSFKLALTTWSILAAHFLCLGYALWKVKDANCPEERATLMIGAVSSVFGICIFPQAIHLFQPSHLLQVIAPAILTTGLFITRLIERFPRSGLPVWTLAVPAYALLLLVVWWQFPGGHDLSSWSKLRSRYGELATGINSRPYDPRVQMIAAAHEMTKPDDKVLVLPKAGSQPMQMYALIKRPMAGVVAMQWGGVFSEDEWRLRAIKSIALDRPAIVIAGSDFIYSAGPWWQRWYPELYEYVRDNYPKIAFQRGDWLILRRN